jgi:hypothetical protein
MTDSVAPASVAPALRTGEECLPNSRASCGALASVSKKELAPIYLLEKATTQPSQCGGCWVRKICVQQHDNRMRQQNSRKGFAPRDGRNGGSGNVRQKYEKYLVRQRDAQVAGDEVEMENCHQHAEHYWRLTRAAAGEGCSSEGPWKG